MFSSFVFLMIISFFLLSDGTGRERQVCEKEDIDDIVRSYRGRKVCLKKRIAKKTINQLRDHLEQLKMDIKSLGSQHKRDLKKILSALLRLEGKNGSHEKTTTKKHPKKTTTEAPKPKIGRSCADAMGTSKTNGIYDILIPKYSDQPFKVACEKGWTIILRRMNGYVDFYRGWDQYKKGFGQLDGEFILGLDKIHAITKDEPQELFVLLEYTDGKIVHQSYDAFAIGDELDLYKLHTLGHSSGTAGDALEYHRGKYFSTFDRKNDQCWFAGPCECAKMYRSAGWFHSCSKSNLLGNYGDPKARGVVWETFRYASYAIRRAIMMLRPKRQLTNSNS